MMRTAAGALPDFREAMLETIAKNAHKDGLPMGIPFIFAKLQEEYAEVMESIASQSMQAEFDWQPTRAELVDLAVTCMLFWDRIEEVG